MKTAKFLWHPNIDPDSGEICLSLFMDSNDDRWKYLDDYERWTPAYSMETIIMSVISTLAEPALEGPVNVDAAIQYRDDFEAFKKVVLICVKASQL